MSAKIFESSPARLLLALLLLLASVVAAEIGREAQRRWRRFQPPLLRPAPNGLTRFSLLAALANEARLGADLAYIECLQYIGDSRNQADGNFQRALPLYQEVAWLDPGFDHAVLEGVSLLGWLLNRPLEAKALADATRTVNPNNERLAAYILALAYQEKLDSAAVIEALRPELMRPDAPEMVLRMVGSIYLKKKDWTGAIQYWRWVLARAKTPMTRELARRALRKATGMLAGQGGGS
jgi:tetratricopeptide (TPR) repeat protein